MGRKFRCFKGEGSWAKIPFEVQSLAFAPAALFVDDELTVWSEFPQSPLVVCIFFEDDESARFDFCVGSFGCAADDLLYWGMGHELAGPYFYVSEMLHAQVE